MSITITSQFQKLNDDIMTCEKAIYLVKKKSSRSISRIEIEKKTKEIKPPKDV